jgi:hypothetical protein
MAAIHPDLNEYGYDGAEGGHLIDGVAAGVWKYGVQGDQEN